jgi:hypothetical protein
VSDDRGLGKALVMIGKGLFALAGVMAAIGAIGLGAAMWLPRDDGMAWSYVFLALVVTASLPGAFGAVAFVLGKILTDRARPS